MYSTVPMVASQKCGVDHGSIRQRRGRGEAPVAAAVGGDLPDRYIASMWVNGITQGLMWRAVNEDGTLTYSFVAGDWGTATAGYEGTATAGDWGTATAGYEGTRREQGHRHRRVRGHRHRREQGHRHRRVRGHRASGITVLQAADLIGQARVGVAVDLGLGIGDQA